MDVIIDQEVLDVTPEMFYWLEQIKTNYTLWYPEAHLSAKLEKLENGRTILLIEEYVGAYHIVFRFQETEKKGEVIILTSDNKPMGKLTHKIEPTIKGMKMQTILTFPAKTPRAFIDSMYGHFIEEMQDLSRFLPKLYKQKMLGNK